MTDYQKEYDLRLKMTTFQSGSVHIGGMCDSVSMHLIGIPSLQRALVGRLFIDTLKGGRNFYFSPANTVWTNRSIEVSIPDVGILRMLNRGRKDSPSEFLYALSQMVRRYRHDKALLFVFEEKMRESGGISGGQ